MNAIARNLLRQLDRFSTGGWLLGLVFFALALTPSLIPRNFIVQGILCGCTFAAGYGIGASLQWLWNYLELRWWNPAVGKWLGRILALACLILAVSFLWFAAGWQNSIRGAMGIPPVEARHPLLIVAVAVLPAAVLIGLGMLLVGEVRIVSRWLARVIPPRAALVGAVLIVAVAVGLVGEGVIARGLFDLADRFYGNFDTLAGSATDAPTDPLRSGGPGSLVDWDTIGLDARVYVQSGPTPAEIAEITGRPAIKPLRIYVGLRSAGTPEERAALALAEMDRVGAFDRSVLLLAMPVGTGWVEPAAIDTLEFLHGGDVASVAVQYSYLTSWISLVAEPDLGVQTAQALFSAVYERWTAMPHDRRPRLFLHGLSLGAYSAMAATTLYDVIGDPFDGALWVGPPFASATWRNHTLSRAPGSPWWRPQFARGTAVRFSNGNGDLAQDIRPWGPMRIIYLQYPSDPIVFFEPAMLWREPVWLSGERAEGVSPLLNWYPVVTFLQLALDMALAQTAPIGFGHVYAPQDYLDGWVQVSQPQGWSEAELGALRGRLSRHGNRHLIEGGWFRTPG